MPQQIIDPSLAKGIRRAYLESLDATWEKFEKIQKRDRLRHPYLQVESRKAFDREVERLRRNIDSANLMPCEITIKLKHRALWASMFLTRDLEKRSDVNLDHGMTPTGFARVQVCALTYPANEWIAPMSIRITAHAIDRLIQRTGILDLPLTPQDIRAINAELSQSLIWAAAAFFILGKIKVEEGPELTLIFPSPNGFFIGKLDIDPIELSVVTYVDRRREWQEQEELLRFLDAVKDTDIALFAADVIARRHIDVEHGDIDASIYRCWRDYGWRIREKVDRPGQLDRYWKSN